MGVGAGFLFLVWGAQFAGPDFKVGLWWLAGLYLIHSVAELCISPVGLSMITKLSIARIVGMMMGVWFLSISVAQYVAGLVAQVASVETVGGQVTNLQVSLNTYVGVFTTIAWVAIGIGVILFLLSWPLRYGCTGSNDPSPDRRRRARGIDRLRVESAAQGTRRSGSTRIRTPRPTSAIPGR